MADDRKKPELFSDFDEDGWDSAIEEWGASLELEAPTKEPAKEAASPAPTSELPDDPLMALVADGEIEFEDSAGAALGSLLGGPAAPPPEMEDFEHDDQTVLAPAASAEMAALMAHDDIGISPDDVAHAETDIEVSVGWDSDSTPVGPGVPPPELAKLARRPDRQSSELPADEDVAEYQSEIPTNQALRQVVTSTQVVDDPLEPFSAPAPVAPPAVVPPAAVAPPAVVLPAVVPPAVVPPAVVAKAPQDDAVEESLPVGKVPLRQVRQSASFAVEERIRGKIQQPEIRQEPGPVSLDVFDELVPEPHTRLAESDVEAGEMLPAPEASEPPPTAIFEGIEAAEDDAPPPLAPISDALCAIDVQTLTAPEQGLVEVDAQHWSFVRQALRGAADRASSSAEAAEMEAFAALAAERSGAPEQALELYREVLQHRPKDVAGLHGLWRMLRADGREREARGEVLEALGETYQGAARRALELMRADHLWSAGGDDAGARALLGDSSGGSLRALLLRADLAIAAGDRQEQQLALDALIAAIEPMEGEHSISAALRLEQGRLREADGVHSLALESYQRVVVHDAANLGGWEGVSRAACAVGRADTFAEALRGSAPLLGSWEGQRLRRRATMVLHGRIEGDAIAELKTACERDEEDLLSRQLLVEEYRRRGDGLAAEFGWRELGTLLPTPKERAQACFEAGTLAEQREEGKAAAVEFYELALRNVAGHAAAADAVARLQRNAPSAEERLDAHRAAAEGNTGAGKAVQHLVAAAILAAELDKPQEATEELRKALAADTSCNLARGQLLRALQSSGDRQGLAELETAAAEHEDDPLRATAFFEQAGLTWLALGESEKALQAFQAAMERDALRLPLRWGVQRALHKLEQWDDLIEELAAEARASELDRAALLWRRRGDLLLRQGAWEEATESYRLATQGADAPWARWSLVRAAARAGRWEEVGDLFAALSDRLDASGGAYKALQLRLGLLRETVLDDASAAALAYEAAAADPNPAPGARDGLARGHRLGADPEQRAGELRAEVERSSSDEERFALFIALGELLQHQGTDWDEAEENFRKALQLRADHPVARRALEVLYHGRGAWQSLSDLMFGHLTTVTDTRIRVMIYERLAERDFSRGDQVSAALTYDSIIEHDAANVHALRFLARRYLEEGRWRELMATLRAEAQAAEAGDRGALYAELARLLTAHPVLELKLALGDADDSPLMATSELLVPTDDGEDEEEAPAPTAVEAYDAALACDGASDLLMQQALAEARSRSDGERLGDLYLRRAAAVAETDPREAAVLEARAAAARGDDLDLYVRALERHPANLGAIYALRDAALRAEAWKQAGTAAEAEAKASRIAVHRLAAHLLAGALAAEHLEAPEKAMSHFRAVLDQDPQSRHAFDRLDGLLAHAERWDDLVRMLSDRIAVELDTERLKDLHGRLATIAQERLGDRELARTQLLALLEFEPENVPALDRLADLYEADDRFSEAADTLIRRARLEKDRGALRDILLRLGRLYQERVEDVKRAILSLTKVLALDPGHHEALTRLSDLYMKDLDFEQALEVTTKLFEAEEDAQKQVDHLLRIANIHEDGLRDSHLAARSFRQALEQAPADLRAIGALCGFYARQGDQRSVMIHLDRSVATMRTRLKQDPFEAFAYQALFKIFGWRKHPDGCLCAAQVLEALGGLGTEEREFVSGHAGGVGTPGSALGAPEHDEWTFIKTIPGGFRQIFQTLDTSLNKVFKGDIKKHGVSRSDKVSGGSHPVKALADGLARDFGIADFDLYISQAKSTEIAVENTSTPSIILGQALLQGATEDELLFLLGRCFWLIRKAMVLPIRFFKQLDLLVAGVVRQYVPDFEPAGADLRDLKEITKQVGKAIPRKLKQELEVFAYECSGDAVDLGGLGPALIHSANRAGLLACRSIEAAVTALRRVDGRLEQPKSAEERVALLQDNAEVEELLRFAVSDAYFELRRRMNVAIR